MVYQLVTVLHWPLLQREWSVVHFLEDHSVCYVPSSWIESELITMPSGQQRGVVRCYWPSKINDEKILPLIRSCSQPDRETWALLHCKCKGIFNSTDAAQKALKEIEGTDSTTDTDAASQLDYVTDNNDGPSQTAVLQVDHVLVKELLQTGAEREYKFYYIII